MMRLSIELPMEKDGSTALSLGEVRGLDAGNGERIPTVEEVLKMAGGRTGLMLELKVDGVAHLTVQAVQKAGFDDARHLCLFLT